MTDSLNTLGMAYLQRQHMLQDQAAQAQVDAITQAARDAAAFHMQRTEMAEKAGMAAGQLEIQGSLSYAPDTEVAGRSGEMQGQAATHMHQLANTYLMNRLGITEQGKNFRNAMRYDPVNIEHLTALGYAQLGEEKRRDREKLLKDMLDSIDRRSSQTNVMGGIIQGALDPGVADQNQRDRQRVIDELNDLNAGRQLDQRRGGAGRPNPAGPGAQGAGAPPAAATPDPLMQGLPPDVAAKIQAAKNKAFGVP